LQESVANSAESSVFSAKMATP